MAALSRQPLCVASALVVPLLTLMSPGVLKLGGVSPAWAVLWLLPWSLVEGRFSGAMAGLALGLLLDGLWGGTASLIPGLMLLGWWWGRIGRRGPPIQRSFNLALLALLGTLLLDGSLMLQWAVRSWLGVSEALVPVEGSMTTLALREGGVQPALLALPGWLGEDLLRAGLYVLLAQTLITALLAPILCSLQLLLWRQLISGWR
jgi:cell shape-determining protein MreD